MGYTRVIFLTCLISFIMFPAAIARYKTLIIELDDVLFTTQESPSESKLGKYTAEYYIKRLFDIVNTLEVPYVPQTQVFYKNYALPPAWRLYFLNYYTSKTMYERVTEAIRKNVAWFWPERAILLHAASIAFDPQKEAEYLVPIIPVHALLSQCAQKSNVRLILLSNKNTETIDALRQKYPELFALFKYICVSGILKQLKPSKQAYKEVLKRYQLDAADCYVIEAKQENSTIAQELGMTSILYEHKTVSSVSNAALRYQLVHHKIL